MAQPTLRVGISASVLHADPGRRVYNGRPLLYLEQSMATWLLEAAALAYVIPFAPEDAPVEADLEQLVCGLDAVVLQGGVDVAPETYGEPEMAEQWPGDAVRDAYELELVRACLKLDRPLLGICRGHQILNVACGGTLYQDIATQVAVPRAHIDREAYEQNTHPVDIVADTRLSQIYGGQLDGLVNSVHHQAIKDLGEDLVVEARSVGDGVIEAIRLDSEQRYAAGVQWHPEFQSPDDDHLLDRFAVLEDFLEAARRRKHSVARP